VRELLHPLSCLFGKRYSIATAERRHAFAGVGSSLGLVISDKYLFARLGSFDFVTMGKTMWAAAPTLIRVLTDLPATRNCVRIPIALDRDRSASTSRSGGSHARCRLELAKPRKRFNSSNNGTHLKGQIHR